MRRFGTVEVGPDGRARAQSGDIQAAALRLAPSAARGPEVGLGQAIFTTAYELGGTPGLVKDLAPDIEALLLLRRRRLGAERERP